MNELYLDNVLNNMDESQLRSMSEDSLVRIVKFLGGTPALGRENLAREIAGVRGSRDEEELLSKPKLELIEMAKNMEIRYAAQTKKKELVEKIAGHKKEVGGLSEVVLRNILQAKSNVNVGGMTKDQFETALRVSEGEEEISR